MPAPVLAAGVALEKSDLFVARQAGYHTYRIPGIVITLDGTLLAYATARDGNIWDYGNYDTVLRRSADGGKTWSPMEVLVDAGKSTVDNCVLIVDKKRKGVVHHLYCVDYAHTCYRRSTDHARTFSPATEIVLPFAAFGSEYKFILRATGPGHGIQLESGRLVVPVWLSPSKDQFPSAVSVIYSDDFGDTWSRGPIIVRSGDPPTHPMEGVVAQLSDGRVMMNIRNEAGAHRRAVAYSPNGVTDWTAPKFDPELREPICFGSLLAVPREIAGSGGVLLFSNPDNVARSVDIGPKHYRDRKNMTVKLSLNDGADWPKSLVIEPGFSGYSDLCVAPDGTVYCLYERGAITSYYDPAAITLARFKLGPWLQPHEKKD
jgi:sialidase-1